MSKELAVLSSATFSTFREIGLTKELWDHQRAALEYVVRARRVFIADDIGVGKTAIAIAAVALLKAVPALVVPPAFLRYTWQRAIASWLPGSSVRVVEPGEPLELPDQSDPDFFIVSYNLLGQQETDPKTGKIRSHNHLVRDLRKRNLRAIICDEAHALKNGKSLRTKAVRALATGIGVRMLLGANPIEKQPKELVSQLDILNQLGPFDSKWKFLQRYCNRWGENVKKMCEACAGRKVDAATGRWCKPCRGTGRGFGLWDFTGAHHLDELNRRLRETCYIQREKAAVHRSLPPLTEARIELDITNRREYNRAESDFMAWIADQGDAEALGAASRAQALVKTNELLRLASEGKREEASGWIQEFLEGNPKEKLVIFTRLRATAAFYAGLFKADALVGGVPIRRRDEMIARFQDPQGSRIIVVNMEAGGTGIELFAASNCVFVELQVWLPTTYAQAAGRLHRPGQVSPVTAWFLLGRGTREEEVLDVITARAGVVRAVLRGAGAGGVSGQPHQPGASPPPPAGSSCTGAAGGQGGQTASQPEHAPAPAPRTPSAFGRLLGQLV